MALTRYETRKFSPERLARIETANQICDEYAAQGLVLTLRQLYYQHVARGLIPNKQTEYNNLGELCRDARMAGLMDWDHLIDRTRNLASFRTWDGPEHLMKDSAEKYHRDLWKPQKKRIEVWIEKDAAIGVIEGVCQTNSVPYFSCRGYTSMSEMHEAAQRIRSHIEDGEQVLILHVGDHDPSGIDMSRDIEDRLRKFISVDWAGLHMGRGAWTRGQIRYSMLDWMEDHGNNDCRSDTQPWAIKRIALNYDQVQTYDPPPNPAKTTDARFRRYADETGLDESWELDALDPLVLSDLVQTEIDALRDEEAWGDAVQEMDSERRVLMALGNYWPRVKTYATEELMK